MSESVDQIRNKIIEVLTSNNAIILATTGGDYSPWVLGAYFVSDELDIYLLLEAGGKSYGNIKLNNRVAYSISQNDATKDFIQGRGYAEVLPADEESRIREMLVKKMPWYQTFVPMVPIKIVSEEIFVTSLQNRWFPAKVFKRA